MYSKLFKRFIASMLALAMTLSGVTNVTVLAVETDSNEYEIYPTPQVSEYAETEWILDMNANVVYEDGIDILSLIHI